MSSHRADLTIDNTASFLAMRAAMMGGYPLRNPNPAGVQQARNPQLVLPTGITNAAPVAPEPTPANTNAVPIAPAPATK